MDKKKIELLITALLIIAFCAAAANAVRTVARKRRLDSSIAAPAAVSGVLPQAKQPESIERQESAAQEKGPEFTSGRDPFRRQSSPKPAAARSAKDNKNNIEGFLLTGIVCDERDAQENYCILNAEVLGVGQSADGFVIVQIEKDYIILSNEKENKHYILKVWGEPQAI